MSKLTRWSLAAALLLLAAGSAAAAVTVTFVNADTFTDVPRSDSERHSVLAGLENHFKLLAAGLPAGQDMKVDVLDIDLAGQVDPSMRHLYDVRIMRGQADWPRMKLRYTIEEQGKVIQSGEENLSDMVYMGHLNRYARNDTLRYEKRMIDDWFKNTVAARQTMGVPSVNSAAVR